MSERIKVHCPVCSSKLAAPMSAVGKVLLCPKCNTRVSVPHPGDLDVGMTKAKSVSAGSTSNASKDNTMATGRAGRRKSRRIVFLTILTVVSMTVVAAWRLGNSTGEAKVGINGQSDEIEKALRESDFDLVLAIQPNHVDALIGRLQRSLEIPPVNVDRAMGDLQHLQLLAPDHPIHREIAPTLAAAKAKHYAESGRIGDAIHELENAIQLEAAIPKLTLARQAVNDALLMRAQASLTNQEYQAAIDDCMQLAEIAEDLSQVMPIAAKAVEERSKEVNTSMQMKVLLQAADILLRPPRSEAIANDLQQLQFRGCQLAVTEGDLPEAAHCFLELPKFGRLKPEMLEYGEELFRLTSAAYRTGKSDSDLQNSLQIVALLDVLTGGDEKVLRHKIALCDKIVSVNDPVQIDGNLDFIIQTIQLAQFGDRSHEWYSILIRTSALALGERSIERLKQGRLENGYRDLQRAIALFPAQERRLLARTRLLPEAILEQLDPDLRKRLSLNEHDEFWSIIPQQTIAFSLIRDLEEYSVKVDQLAEYLNFAKPQLLERGCNLCRIHDGLDRSGSLAWVKVQNHVPKEDNQIITQDLFFLATTDFQRMIQELRPEPSGSIWQVKMIDGGGKRKQGLGAPIGHFGAFAFEKDRTALEAILDAPQDNQTEFSVIGAWATDLDACFVLTPQGIRNGLQKYDMPLPTPQTKLLIALVHSSILSTHAILDQSYPAELHSVRQAIEGWNAPQLREWARQLAVGLSIEPEYGICLRSRLWLKSPNDLNEILSENPGGREYALKHLPDLPFILAVGGPVSPVQSEWISSLPELLDPTMKRLNMRVSSIATMLLTAESDRAMPDHLETAVWPGFDGGIVIAATVDDAPSGMIELGELIDSFVQLLPQNFENVLPADLTISLEQGKLPDGTDVVRLQLKCGEYERMMRIGAPDNQTIVFATGGDEQIARVIAPFRGKSNLTQSPTVRMAVRMLPDATSYVTIADSRYLCILTNGLMIGRSDSVANFLAENPMPIALGMSWRKSDLDVDLSIPWETLAMFHILLPRLP